MRGFSDIAILYRTHRQAALLEKCLRQEGIPYVVAGREDFLQEREVRATLYFFRHVLYLGEAASEVLCHRLLGPFLGERQEEGLILLLRLPEGPGAPAPPTGEASGGVEQRHFF